MTPLGKRIKEYRTRANLTQLELANKIGNISDKSISSWEKGRAEPSMGDIQKMSVIFHCSVSDLVDDDPQTITIDEMNLLGTYRQLNPPGKTEAQKQVENLTYIPKYKKASAIKEEYDVLAAHADSPDADIKKGIDIVNKAVKKEYGD